MPTYIAFDAWRGFNPLIKYDSKRGSHARVVVLMTISLTATSGYFWGELAELADATVLSRGEVGRLVKDLEDIGALKYIPHSKIPDHIRPLIETKYPLPPNKKVWRVTGEYTIDNTLYKYEWTGTGLNVQKADISNVHLVNISLSEHNRDIDIESIDTNKDKKISTPNGDGNENEQVKPIDKPVKGKKSKPESLLFPLTLSQCKTLSLYTHDEIFEARIASGEYNVDRFKPYYHLVGSMIAQNECNVPLQPYLDTLKSSPAAMKAFNAKIKNALLVWETYHQDNPITVEEMVWIFLEWRRVYPEMNYPTSIEAIEHNGQTLRTRYQLMKVNADES